jgi:lipopolysaccharide biosynthesis regulator YciM
MVMDDLVECHHRQNETEELLDYLDQIEQKHTNIPLIESHAKVIERYNGKDAAINYVMQKLRKTPSLQGMNQLLSYRDTESNKEAYAMMMRLKDAVDVMKQEQSAFQCKQCGFKTNTLYWLCPGCHNWGSVKPYNCEPVC